MNKVIKTVEIACPAKINLFLNVIDFDKQKKLHKIKLVNQTIDLYDNITISKNNKAKEINIISKDNIPNDNTNSAYIACDLFFKYTNIPMNGININIVKNIPNMAGLGGESTDAAGVLLGLNTYYNRILKKEELINLAMKIGSDVPYFIIDDYAIVNGYGEIVSRLKTPNPYNNYLIMIPNFGINTKEMYKKFDINNPIKKEQEYIEGILYNDFINVMPDELKKLRNFLLENYSNLNHSLSGSGSAYYIASPTGIPNKIKKDIANNFKDYTFYNQNNCNKHKIIIKIY